MKSVALAKIGIVPLLACAFISCAAVKDATSATTAKVTSSLAKLPNLSDTAIVRMLPGQRVKVVEVREKDLKDLPTGKEKAMAYRKGRSGFWIFGGPVDFQEPTLPEPGADPDGSLLPPRVP